MNISTNGQSGGDTRLGKPLVIQQHPLTIKNPCRVGSGKSEQKASNHAKDESYFRDRFGQQQLQQPSQGEKVSYNRGEPHHVQHQSPQLSQSANNQSQLHQQPSFLRKSQSQQPQLQPNPLRNTVSVKPRLRDISKAKRDCKQLLFSESGAHQNGINESESPELERIRLLFSNFDLNHHRAHGNRSSSRGSSSSTANSDSNRSSLTLHPAHPTSIPTLKTSSHNNNSSPISPRLRSIGSTRPPQTFRQLSDLSSNRDSCSSNISNSSPPFPAIPLLTSVEVQETPFGTIRKFRRSLSAAPILNTKESSLASPLTTASRKSSLTPKTPLTAVAPHHHQKVGPAPPTPPKRTKGNLKLKELSDKLSTQEWFLKSCESTEASDQTIHKNNIQPHQPSNCSSNNNNNNSSSSSIKTLNSNRFGFTSISGLVKKKSESTEASAAKLSSPSTKSSKSSSSPVPLTNTATITTTGLKSDSVSTTGTKNSQAKFKDEQNKVSPGDDHEDAEFGLSKDKLGTKLISKDEDAAGNDKYSEDEHGADEDNDDGDDDDEESENDEEEDDEVDEDDNENEDDEEDERKTTKAETASRAKSVDRTNLLSEEINKLRRETHKDINRIVSGGSVLVKMASSPSPTSTPASQPPPPQSASATASSSPSMETILLTPTTKLNQQQSDKCFNINNDNNNNSNHMIINSNHEADNGYNRSEGSTVSLRYQVADEQPNCSNSNLVRPKKMDLRRSTSLIIMPHRLDPVVEEETVNSEANNKNDPDQAGDCKNRSNQQVIREAAATSTKENQYSTLPRRSNHQTSDLVKYRQLKDRPIPSWMNSDKRESQSDLLNDSTDTPAESGPGKEEERERDEEKKHDSIQETGQIGNLVSSSTPPFRSSSPLLTPVPPKPSSVVLSIRSSPPFSSSGSASNLPNEFDSIESRNEPVVYRRAPRLSCSSPFRQNQSIDLGELGSCRLSQVVDLDDEMQPMEQGSTASLGLKMEPDEIRERPEVMSLSASDDKTTNSNKEDEDDGDNCQLQGKSVDFGDYNSRMLILREKRSARRNHLLGMSNVTSSSVLNVITGGGEEPESNLESLKGQRFSPLHRQSSLPEASSQSRIIGSSDSLLEEAREADFGDEEDDETHSKGERLPAGQGEDEMRKKSDQHRDYRPIIHRRTVSSVLPLSSLNMDKEDLDDGGDGLKEIKRDDCGGDSSSKTLTSSSQTGREKYRNIERHHSDTTSRLGSESVDIGDLIRSAKAGSSIGSFSLSSSTHEGVNSSGNNSALSAPGSIAASRLASSIKRASSSASQFNEIPSQSMTSSLEGVSALAETDGTRRDEGRSTLPRGQLDNSNSSLDYSDSSTLTFPGGLSMINSRGSPLSHGGGSLSGSPSSSSSPSSTTNRSRYAKKPLRGPYGEMLEKEIRKSSMSEKQRSLYADLAFLSDLIEANKRRSEDSSSDLTFKGSDSEISTDHHKSGLSNCSSLEDNNNKHHTSGTIDSDSIGPSVGHPTKPGKHHSHHHHHHHHNHHHKPSNSSLSSTSSSASSSSSTRKQVTPTGAITPTIASDSSLPKVAKTIQSAAASSPLPSHQSTTGAKGTTTGASPGTSSSTKGITSSDNSSVNKYRDPLMSQLTETEQESNQISSDSETTGRWSKSNHKNSSSDPFRRSIFVKRHTDTRTHVVGELYDTEKSYVESLQILVNKYMRPLKSAEYSNLVDSNLVDLIFYQIPEILKHHEAFLDTLKQRLTNWDSKQKVGDVFVEAFTKQPIIDTYTAFINNWKIAKEAIKTAIQAKQAFARYLENMSREHKGKLTLDAILIMPVQRIPRYELLIKELIKHTNVDHPDHQLLLMAQKEVHELALKINRMEREAFEQEQMAQKVKDIEHFIEGVIDLSSTDRTFIRFDFVSIPGGLGTKKERCLFLFSDLLLITSIKKKSGATRKFSSASSTPSPLSTLEGNKYKYLTRFPLDTIDITRGTDGNLRKTIKEIDNLKEDLNTLNQINDLMNNLNCSHQPLDEAMRDLFNNVTRHLNDKQTSDSQLLSLELQVTSPSEVVDDLTIIFPSTEKRSAWESAFVGAKKKLSMSNNQKPPPEFLCSIPVRKTRAGLQFTCASATIRSPQYNYKDVWIGNSDGYVGQICILNLTPSPAVSSCTGICNSRIHCIASIPTLPTNNNHNCYPISLRRSFVSEEPLSLSETSGLEVTETDVNTNCSLLMSTCSTPSLSNLSSASIQSSPPASTNSFLVISNRPESMGTSSSPSRSLTPTPSTKSKQSTTTTNSHSHHTSHSPSHHHHLHSSSAHHQPGHRSSSSQFQLDSESSDEENNCSPVEETVDLDRLPSETSQSPVDSCHSMDCEPKLPSMWIGTEDGCIYIYNCNDNIRVRKNKIKIQLHAAVHCILYLDNCVYSGLANGQIVVFTRDPNGTWQTTDFKTYTIDTGTIFKLTLVTGKLWCLTGNQVKIVTLATMEVEKTFQVTSDPEKVILSMVNSGLGVWMSTQGSPVIKLYHATSCNLLLEIDITPAVTRMLTTCDEIIRQHKAACLRVTALLTCKDLLWIGTSAGTIMTLPLPHVTPSTTSVDHNPNISTIQHGHTGHVRFLTTVDVQSHLSTPNSSSLVSASSASSASSHSGVSGGSGVTGDNQFDLFHSSSKSYPSSKRLSQSNTSSSGKPAKLYVVSGGDGYEDFSNFGHAADAAGRDDSTNHILLWQI